LLFYINRPAVIIGRNQNTAEEIDPDFIAANSIHVVRRLSGGGAVYHDLGNLNFSFITAGKEDLHNFSKFIEPVLAVLRKLGLDAQLQGKSDIFAAGKKISGNAQYVAANRMFSHGTLLFDTNIENMLKALNPRQAQIESKAVQSVRNYVANIRELLPNDMDIEELRQAILTGIALDEEVTEYQLTAEEWQQVRQIASERYATWEWNYGRSPAFNFRNSGQLPGGKIDVRLDVAQGTIQSAKIYGSFAGRREVAELEAKLHGVRHQRAAIEGALAELDLKQYLGQITKSELIDLLY
jgi:lipoate-protein ligase A